MITAVDTIILIDVFRDDSKHGRASAGAVRRHERCSTSTWTCSEWRSSPSNGPPRRSPGELWRQYRSRGGRRKRILADFLIAAHAKVQCERLLTRDRGFCRDYFNGLHVIDPSASPA